MDKINGDDYLFLVRINPFLFLTGLLLTLDSLLSAEQGVKPPPSQAPSPSSLCGNVFLGHNTELSSQLFQTSFPNFLDCSCMHIMHIDTGAYATKYSGVPIFRTSKGNENWLEKSDSLRNRR